MILPIMMLKNEEIWLREIIQPILNVFGVLIVGDTGSTDSTISILHEYPQVHLNFLDTLTPDKIGIYRYELSQAAKDLGASHAMMIDGDELYTTKALRYIKETGLPEGYDAGFTTGLEIHESMSGEFHILGKKCHWIRRNQLAVFSVDSLWKGSYPFESPDVFRPDSRNYYWKATGMRHSTHHYHLHQCTRSSKDEETYMRMQKRNLYSMQPNPEILPYSLWLKRKEDYEDEL